VVGFVERKEASRLHVLTWKGTACIVTWKGNMKGAFQFGNKGNISLLVSRNKKRWYWSTGKQRKTYGLLVSCRKKKVVLVKET
jgi:hypothetical protein